MNRENIIRNLSYLSRCHFDLRYVNRYTHEIICVNCLIDEPIVERTEFDRKTTHFIVISNHLKLIHCDICHRLVTKVRPARACSKCKESLFEYLNTRSDKKIIDIRRLAFENPLTLVHDF